MVTTNKLKGDDMKLSKQVYSNTGDGKIALTYELGCSFKCALNFTGHTWVDHKYSFVKTVLPKHKLIVTNSDLLAHDDYLELLSTNQTVVFIHTGITETQCGASPKRIKQAMDKLKQAGIHTKYFVSWDAMERYVSNYKGVPKPKQTKQCRSILRLAVNN